MLGEKDALIENSLSEKVTEKKVFTEVPQVEAQGST